MNLLFVTTCATTPIRAMKMNGRPAISAPFRYSCSSTGAPPRTSWIAIAASTPASMKASTTPTSARLLASSGAQFGTGMASTTSAILTWRSLKISSPA
nr:hypothetical protein [Massilia sp. Dwa41.01b]